MHNSVPLLAGEILNLNGGFAAMCETRWTGMVVVLNSWIREDATGRIITGLPSALLLRILFCFL